MATLCAHKLDLRRPCVALAAPGSEFCSAHRQLRTIQHRKETIGDARKAYKKHGEHQARLLVEGRGLVWAELEADVKAGTVRK